MKMRIRIGCRLAGVAIALLACGCQPRGLRENATDESRIAEELNELKVELRETSGSEKELADLLREASLDRRDLRSKIDSMATDIGRLHELVAELKGQLSAVQEASSMGNAQRPPSDPDGGRPPNPVEPEVQDGQIYRE